MEENMSEQILVVQALEEALELLQEENARLRNNNRILRIVNSGLRSKLETAQKNDEEFKSLCQLEPEPEVESGTSWGSYPTSVADATGTSYEVEQLDQEADVHVGSIDIEALNQLRKKSYY
jgi:hypothetical protein